MSGSRSVAAWTAPFALGLMCAVGWAVFLSAPLNGDEPVHVAQIRSFLSGSGEIHPWLTTFPTFHWLAAQLARPWNSEDLGILRLASVLLGFTAVPAAIAWSRALHGNTLVADLRAASVVTMPIALPYLFLVYTDMFALGLVLSAAWLACRRRWGWAACCALLALAVRQTNWVWALWLVGHYLLAEEPWHHGWRGFRRAVVEISPAWLGLIAFAAFLLVNGGVALGDEASHPVGFLYDGNILFITVLLAILFLPSHFFRSRSTWEFVNRHRLPVAAVAISFCVWFVLGFEADHPYNRLPYHVHNEIAMWFDAPLHRAAAAPFLAWAIVSTVAMTGIGRDLALWFAATLLALAPIWMIEHRYAIVPLAILMIQRPALARTPEIVQFIWLALLGIGALWWIHPGPNSL